ncbi:MAG TPA: phosphate-starvation-inducible PsiE family protein [Fimbriimonadaceae bacterium]|jgi:uncharacterized membrane protein (DUF373 family)
MAHSPSDHGSGHKHGIVHYLEGGDGVAHVIVALFLLLLSLCIIGYGTYSFVADLTQLKPAVTQNQETGKPLISAQTTPAQENSNTTSEPGAATNKSPEKTEEPQPFAERFGEIALTFLSDLLFGVVVLELLSTILTYIQARNLEATIKDFLVVALISSIRKILLIGAQSSLEKSTANEFTMEATGTVVSILGILLLIAGLLLLDRRAKAKAAEEAEAAAALKVTADLETA